MFLGKDKSIVQLQKNRSQKVENQYWNLQKMKGN